MESSHGSNEAEFARAGLRSQDEVPIPRFSPEEVQRLTNAIAGASDIEALLEVVRHSQGIQGTREFFTPEALVNGIEGVFYRGDDPKEITDACKLRTKVLELKAPRT